MQSTGLDPRIMSSIYANRKLFIVNSQPCFNDVLPQKTFVFRQLLLYCASLDMRTCDHLTTLVCGLKVRVSWQRQPLWAFEKLFSDSGVRQQRRPVTAVGRVQRGVWPSWKLNRPLHSEKHWRLPTQSRDVPQLLVQLCDEKDILAV